MLDGFTRHGLFDLSVRVHGDLQVDDHHTIEDTGIVLGTALKEAIGDKKGIKRYGSCILPMDESLVLCAIDLSGRPYFVWDAEFTTDRIGDMSTEMVKEFFYAISYACGMNLHIRVLAGGNNHHVAEAMFKVTHYVMLFAPIGIFAMISYTVGTFGLEMLIPLGKLVFSLYFAIIVFLIILAIIASIITKLNFWHIFKVLREPLLLGYSTASSEAALTTCHEVFRKIRFTKTCHHIRYANRLFLQPLMVPLYIVL